MNVYLYIDKFPSRCISDYDDLVEQISMRLYERCIVQPLILTARCGWNNDDLLNDLITVRATLLVDNPF